MLTYHASSEKNNLHMNLKRLYSDEMLYISAEWLDTQSAAHNAIRASPELAVALPRMTSAHEELAQNAQPLRDNPRLEAITKEEAALDGRHDDIIRGVFSILTGIAALLGPEQGPAIIELRDNLIPEGLSSTQKTYRAEAGHALQLESRLTLEIRQQTSKLRIDPQHPSHSLMHFLDEWIDIGKRLGALEDEKARLASPDRSPSTLVTARNKWIRMVNLFVAMAEAAEIDAATMQILISPLHAAESKAQKRSGKAPAAPKNQEQPVTKPPSE